MNRFVIVALLLMAWAYWELSGGADFEPERRDIAEAAPEAVTPEAVTPETAIPETAIPEAVTPTPETAPEIETVPESPAAAGAEGRPGDVMPTEATPDPAGPIEHSFDENPLTATPETPPENMRENMRENMPETGAAPESAESTSETTPEAATATGGNLHVVTGSRVNLREGPGTGFATMGQVTEGMILDVLEIRDGWAYVALQDRVEQGWMSASFLAPL